MAKSFAKCVRPQAVALAFLLALTLGATNAARAVDLTGYWSGTWETPDTGHRGPLHAKFSKCNDSQYRVVFGGRFFKVFPFRYAVTLDVIQDGDVMTLSGNSYLGKIFGTFTYNAVADYCSFNCNYTSCKYNGTFNLTRCTAPVDCCE